MDLFLGSLPNIFAIRLLISYVCAPSPSKFDDRFCQPLGKEVHEMSGINLLQCIVRLG